MAPLRKVLLTIFIITGLAILSVTFIPGSVLTGLLVASVVENCVDIFENETLRMQEDFTYSYNVIFSSIEKIDNQTRVIVVLQNNESVPGNFEVIYTFSGREDSAKSEQKEFLGGETKYFEFFGDVGGSLNGSFEVFPPSGTKWVEKTVTKTVRSCQ